MTLPVEYDLADPTWLRVSSAQAPAILSQVTGAVLVGATDLGPTVQVPWTQDVCELLARLRAPHLAPICVHYHWPARFEPFPHQYRVGGFLSTHRRAFCLADMGTGKTISGVWAFDWLYRQQKAKRILVICPLSLMRLTWAAEFANGAPQYKVTVLHHTDPIRRRQLVRDDAVVHVVNYDGVELLYDELMANDYDIVLVDESTAYANINRRWRFARPLVAQSRYAWLFTGTPAVQSPLKAYGQVKLLYGDAWDTTLTAFRDATMVQLSKYKWVAKIGWADTVHAVMQPAIKVNKRDVLKDLPPVVHTTREVPLSAGQKRLMSDLRKSRMTTSNAASISAVHAAALRVKLVQIASGTVYDDNGQSVELDMSARLAETIDIIETVREMEDLTRAPNNKVLVFCAFVHTAERVARELGAKGLKVAVLHGGVSLAARTKAIEDFQLRRDVDAIVAMPDVLSHGLTLTAASTIIWWSPIDKAETAMQANNRMDRPGQKDPMQIIRLQGSSAEEVIYRQTDDRFAQHDDVIARYDELVQSL